MSNVGHGIELLTAAAEEYGPARAGEDTARLEALDLFVQVRELQAMQAGPRALFISEVTAAARPGGKGITVTCVGQGEAMAAAVGDAVAQWCMGVLPVLARWRGSHSCLATPHEIVTRSGPFGLLTGPVLARGAEGMPPEEAGQSPSEPLLPLIEATRPAMRAHWLELFTTKLRDGSVETTCRLNNRDWPPAARALSAVASAWPAPSAPMRSIRQFAMLLPKSVPAQEIVQPSLWERLTGRA